MCACVKSLSFLKHFSTLYVTIKEMPREMKSATVCAQISPFMPNSAAATNRTGMRIYHCRERASREARSDLPMVCSIMLLMMTCDMKEKLMSWARSMRVPTSITSASFLWN